MGYVPVLLVAAALAAAGSAQAAGIGVRAGTTGIGADVAWDLAPTLSTRLGYSALKWNHDVETSNLEYDGKLKLSNLNAMVDFHPLGPLFRITGGLIFNNNKYDVSALGGALTGTVTPERDVAPYLGIGWGTVAGAGVGFYADIGIMFMGTPKATLRCSGLPASTCASLVAGEQARLQDELDHLKHYPVINLGLTIGF